jgi:hypothetical protein
MYAATGCIKWLIGSWFPAAGSSTENVTGGRKLARHVFAGRAE